MVFSVGDKVKWTSQASGRKTVKIGVVARVVEKHESPLYRVANREFPRHRLMFDGISIPGGGDIGYFIEVRDGKTPRAKPKLYLPYPSALHSAE